ncbi:MAG: hypothetical protein QW515_05675 [Thermoplasmatales archaeon]
MRLDRVSNGLGALVVVLLLLSVLLYVVTMDVGSVIDVHDESSSENAELLESVCVN